MVLDYSFVDDDRIELSALLDSAFDATTHNVDDFVRLTQSNGNVKIEVDTDGVGGSSTWSEVAVLSGYATSNVDIVRVTFESADHLMQV